MTGKIAEEEGHQWNEGAINCSNYIWKKASNMYLKTNYRYNVGHVQIRHPINARIWDRIHFNTARSL